MGRGEEEDEDEEKDEEEVRSGHALEVHQASSECCGGSRGIN